MKRVAVVGTGYVGLVTGLVFDTRNILDPDQVRQAGLTYIGMGRCGEFQQSARATACQDALMSSFS